MEGLVRFLTLFYPLSRVRVLFFLMLLSGCGEDPLNNPYPSEPKEANTLYGVFSEQPKHLDLAKSYAENEWVITAQIYEPPLQYHYLKRPYTLEPLVAESMPQVEMVNREGEEFTIYTINIKKGILYQPHPAFAKDEKGLYRYTPYPAHLPSPHTLSDFQYTDTRELIAEDFVYQIKRLGASKTQSPIYGLMSELIVGLKDIRASQRSDLRGINIEGAKVLGRYTYQITLKGQYPQFLHWLAMPFFAPLPWEVEQFYQQPLLIAHNITLDWYPVGTGPYQLSQNDPNYRMVLTKNSNYHGETYPTEGEPTDKERGFLEMAGKPLPFIDKVIFSLEKEAIPYWNKFLQGYYDTSGVASDSFDQAIRSVGSNGVTLTDEMEDRGIHLDVGIEPTIFYWGFNMLDEVVGGNSERAKWLRQAISIAINEEEYVSIFLNGQGIVAQNMIPQGIEGHDARPMNGVVAKKTIKDALELLKKAGYPKGIDPKTGKPLILYLDDIAGSGPDLKAEFTWILKQFKKLGIELFIRATQYNRFQEKLQTGNMQIFKFGWHADYPDPENFLSLLYGPNAEAVHGGVNASNYQNPQFDVLFQKMKITSSGPDRQKVIADLLKIVEEDAPWAPRFYPKRYVLAHQWVAPAKLNTQSQNTIKYRSLDPQLRALRRAEWNNPTRWPFIVLWGICFLICIPGEVYYFRRTYLRPKLEKN